MELKKDQIANYYFPIFIFFIIVTGYWDSLIRKIISFVFPILIVVFFLARTKIKTKMNHETILISIYLMICLVSTILAHNPLQSSIVFFKILIFFLLIAALHKWLSNRSRYLLLLKAITYSGLVLSFSIFFNIIFGVNMIVELEGAIRTGGIYSNVNSAGYVLYASTVFTFLLYLEKRQIRQIIAIVLFLIALFFTGSRASMLALAVTVLFYNLRFRLTKKIVAIATFGIVGLIGAFLFFKDQILLRLRLGRGFSARQILYDIGWSISQDFPFFGVGLGNLKEVGLSYLENYPVGEWRKNLFREIGIQSSHNGFIETWAEIGVFGVLTLIFIVISIGIKYYRATKRYGPKNTYFLLWGLFLGVLARSFFESNGIINRGWITIDIFFWIAFVIFLRSNWIFKVERDNNQYG